MTLKCCQRLTCKITYPCGHLDCILVTHMEPINIRILIAYTICLHVCLPTLVTHEVKQEGLSQQTTREIFLLDTM